jgi:hypothetical protein
MDTLTRDTAEELFADYATYTTPTEVNTAEPAVGDTTASPICYPTGAACDPYSPYFCS